MDLQLVQEYFGFWNAQQRNRWVECLDHDVRHEEPVDASLRAGAVRRDVRRRRRAVRRVSPVELQDVIACGRECAVRFTTTGVRDGGTVSSTVIETWSASEAGKLDGVRVFVVLTLRLV